MQISRLLQSTYLRVFWKSLRWFSNIFIFFWPYSCFIWDRNFLFGFTEISGRRLSCFWFHTFLNWSWAFIRQWMSSLVYRYVYFPFVFCCSACDKGINYAKCGSLSLSVIISHISHFIEPRTCLCHRTLGHILFNVFDVNHRAVSHARNTSKSSPYTFYFLVCCTLSIEARTLIWNDRFFCSGQSKNTSESIYRLLKQNSHLTQVSENQFLFDFSCLHLFNFPPRFSWSTFSKSCW